MAYPRYQVVRHELHYAVVDTEAAPEEWDVVDYGKTVFETTGRASALDDVAALKQLTAEAQIEAFKLNANAEAAAVPTPTEVVLEAVAPTAVAQGPVT